MQTTIYNIVSSYTSSQYVPKEAQEKVLINHLATGNNWSVLILYKSKQYELYVSNIYLI